MGVQHTQTQTLTHQLVVGEKTMSTTSITAAVAAIPSAILLTIAALFIWHWLDTDAGPFDSVQMTFQDVKVAVSCLEIGTSWEFSSRSYDDFLYDKPVFKLPSGNDFICSLYSSDRLRKRDYRETKLYDIFGKMPTSTQTRIKSWIKDQDETDATTFRTYIREVYDLIDDRNEEEDEED